ncbi:hypothetical protein [Caldiplasma sukawensis]
MENSQKLLYSISAGILYLFSIIFTVESGIIVAFNYTQYIIELASLIFIITIVSSFLYFKNMDMANYFMGAFAAAVLLTLLLDFTIPIDLILQGLSIAISIRIMLSGKRSYVPYYISYFFYIFLMAILATLVRYVSFQNLRNIYVLPISADINSAGIPLLFANGISIAGERYFVITFSYPFFILIMLLGFFLIENIRMIIQIASGGSNVADKFTALSLSFTVLSCQCETTTSLIPVIGSEIIGLISLPVITESLLLSILTFVDIKLGMMGKYPHFFSYLWVRKPKRLSYILLVSGLLIVSPLLVTIGVYVNLQSNLLFYFSTNVGLFIVALVSLLIIFQFFSLNFKIDNITLILLGGISGALMIIWYLPQLLSIAVVSGLIFSIMGIISFASGSIIAIVITSLKTREKIVFYEYLAGMFPLIFLIFLYISAVIQVQVWTQFDLLQQIYFSVILLLVSLPVMWYFTNTSIYSYFRRVPDIQ